MKPKPLLKTSLFAGALALAMSFVNSVQSQTVLVDFGLTPTAGAITSSPDTNGNSWNNLYSTNGGGNVVIGGVISTSLVSTTGAVTGATLTSTFLDSMGANGNQTPAANSTELVNAVAVSNPNLAIVTAVEDYWFENTAPRNSVFTISGLNQYETYNFSFLASRADTAPGTRTTTFKVTGSNGPFTTSVNATGTSPLVVGGTTYYANSTVVNIAGVTPSSGNITLELPYSNVGNTSSNFNALQLTGYVAYTNGATHTLSSAMSYPGNTVLSGGTTVTTGSTAGELGGGTSSLEVGSGGGTLNIGANETVTSLIGTGNLAVATGANTLTISPGGSTIFSVLTGGGAQNNGSNVAIDYSGILSGSGTISKTGSGTQILSGANTFGGTFQVSAGTLTLKNVTALQNATLDTTGTGTVSFGVSGTNTYTLGGLAGTVGLSLGSNSLSVGSGTYGGAIAGSGALTKTGSGTLTLSGNNTYSGTTTVTTGTLILNGTNSTSGVSVAAGATLGGSGKVGGALSGAGQVGPGNSPGILTATQVNPTGGLGFAFEFTATGAPTYSSATASVNDVLHLNDATTPFTASLTGSNTVAIYLNLTTVVANDVFQGGFFTDKSLSFLSSINSAAFAYYVKGNGSGSHAYNGFNYSTLAEYNAGLSINLSTVQVGTAAFAEGTVSGGYISEFTFVPEPTTWALLAFSLTTVMVFRRRRRA